MNKAILIGRITKDPEIRYTQNGIPNVLFTLAVDRGFKDAQGNTQADFINCVAWRQQAEFMNQYVKKGYRLAIEGEIQTRNYQNQQGQTIYITEIMCDRVENLTPKEQPQQQAPNQYQGQQYQQPQYGTPNQYQQPQYQGQPTGQYQQPQQPQSFNVDVADDDLPF